MHRPFILLLLLLLTTTCTAPLHAQDAALVQQLAAAQAAKDQASVDSVMAQIITQMGDKAGQPEEVSEFVMPDEKQKLIAADQVPELFSVPLTNIRDHAWWKDVKTGSDSQAPLRAVASVVEGCLAAKEAGCLQSAELLAEAKAAAEFLMTAQKAGGKDCFPFPAWRGKRGKLGGMAEKFLTKAEAAGKLNDVVQNGWIIDDLGTGDLYFDNGLAGVALVKMYEFTKDDIYLTSALKAADWAVAQPCVPNANYNSFLVHLLATVHRVTGEARYLAAAKEKCRLGVLPGQLQSGPNTGRWADAHNAKLVYHFIIMRGFISLLQTMPEADPERPAVLNALTASLKTRNAEIIAAGGTSPDTTLEIYTRLLSDPARFAAIITTTNTQAAASMIFRASLEEFKNEHPTVSPGSWGNYLRYVAGK